MAWRAALLHLKLLSTLRAEHKALPVPLWQRKLKDTLGTSGKPPHSFPGQQQVTEVTLVFSYIAPRARGRKESSPR